jgi:short subunit dehydrogenase-like uncharacterized protein
MSFVIYGATGYTGDLVTREAVDRGHQPTLAGRNRDALEALGRELGLPVSVTPLDQPDALDQLLKPHDAVLHCAGPFSGTSRSMADACIRTKTHYLDITGEIAVFEALARRDAEATRAGVTLLPGVGFDVVPTDCLAAHLSDRLPSATHLRLAFQTRGGVSRGTALTTIQGLGRGGAIRRDGVITPVPVAWKTSQVDFGAGPRSVVTIPWGDVSTAFHSTGIGNIEVSIAMRPSRIRALRRTRPFQRILGSTPVVSLLRGIIQRRLSGPTAEERARGGVDVWGEVSDAEGRRAHARLRGPEGYSFTALAAVRIAERVLQGTSSGFLTPSRACGAEFVLEIPGVIREDLPVEVE